MAMHRYPVVIEEEGDGFVVDCPAFQGCYTQGDTYEEAMENLRDLIRLHLERGVAARDVRSLAVASIDVEA